MHIVAVFSLEVVASSRLVTISLAGPPWLQFVGTRVFLSLSRVCMYVYPPQSYTYTSIKNEARREQTGSSSGSSNSTATAPTTLFFIPRFV